MSNVIVFSHASRFQEYKITGITDRPVDGHIALSLVRVGYDSDVEISAALPRTKMSVNTLVMGDVIRAILSLNPNVDSKDCARKSFLIEAFELREPDTYGEKLLQDLRTISPKSPA